MESRHGDSEIGTVYAKKNRVSSSKSSGTNI